MNEIDRIYLFSLVTLSAVTISCCPSVARPPDRFAIESKSKPQPTLMNSIVPSLFFGTGSNELSYGASGRVGLLESISARPFASFSGNKNISGMAITYDLPTETPQPDNWFFGGGGLVRNVAGVSSGVQPFAMFGGNLGLTQVDLKYVMDNGEFIGSAGINLKF